MKKQKINHTESERLEIVKGVCALYESQNSTLASCCDASGISERTFRYWAASFADIAALYKKAKDKSVEIYWDRLREKAQTGLERLVEGETYTEKRHEVGVTSTGAIDKTTETEVTILPNPTSVIFALKGEYPDRFADRAKTQSTVRVVDGLEKIPLEKRLAALAILEANQNGS